MNKSARFKDISEKLIRSLRHIPTLILHTFKYALSTFHIALINIKVSK